MAQTVDGRAGVDQVVDDSSILDKFYKLLDGARNAVVIIAIILIIAAILLVANTIRLSAFNRRRETSIMRLVGASNFYVQLPFLVEGMIAGLFGWLVAAGLLIGVKSLWLDALQQYFPFNVQLSTTDLVEVIVLAMIIGLVLSRRHVVPDAPALPAGVTAHADSETTVAAEQGLKIIARNRRARHDYHIDDVVEAGLVLTGTEVKSLRAGRASLTDGFGADHRR